MSLLEKASLIVTPNAYKESILYSVVPNATLGDMTVVRATTATRVNSTGLIESVGLNIPRIDYTNGSCPSLLVEPQRTNSIIQSIDLSTFNRTTSALIRTSGHISPGVTNNAFKIIAGVENNIFAILSNEVTTVIGNAYSVSIFLKSAEYSKAGYRDGYTGKYVTFDINSKTQLASNGPTVKFENYANGYVRAIIDYVSTSILNNNYFFILDDNYTSQNPDLYTFTGNGTSGLFMWSPQHEQGSYATSYIPTVAASVTRNADVISKTGISSLIGQTEGTLFVDLNSAYNGWITLSDNSDANGVLLSFSKEYSTLNYFIYANSVDIIGTGFVAFPSEPMKLAFKYKSGEIKLFVNGVLVYTNTATFAFSNNLNFFGNRIYWGGGLFEGSINSEQLYKIALTDAECIDLTTL